MKLTGHRSVSVVRRYICYIRDAELFDDSRRRHRALMGRASPLRSCHGPASRSVERDVVMSQSTFFDGR